MTASDQAFCASLLHTYTERSARSKLARHRKRGDPLHTMFHCPWSDPLAGHWHVVKGTLEEAALRSEEESDA